MYAKQAYVYYCMGYHYHFVKSGNSRLSSWKIIIKIAIAIFAMAKHKISYNYHKNKE